MLTKQMLEAMPEHTIFATGTAMDVPGGLNMTGGGLELRWIAKRGYACDWCIYCHWFDKSIDYIARSGDKVISEEHIRKLVPCDDAAFGLYRY